MNFTDLPIEFNETEQNGEWTRRTKRQGTVAELLSIWNIDDDNEQSEMAQVLRHLRQLCEQRNNPKDLLQLDVIGSFIASDPPLRHSRESYAEPCREGCKACEWLRHKSAACDACLHLMLADETR